MSELFANLQTVSDTSRVQPTRPPSWLSVSFFMARGRPLGMNMGSVKLGRVMDEISDRLLHVFSELEDITSEMTPEEASGALEEPTLQLFWRQWPQVSSWAGSLWRLLNEDTVDPAAAASDEFDEVGGSG